MNNKKMLQTLMIVMCLAIVCVGATFAYYFTTIDNSNKQTVDVTNATAKLTYTDCSDSSDCANISASLAPGDSVSKTFKVENTGSLAITYDLYFASIQNTFTNDELVYTVTDLDTDSVVVSSTKVPYYTTATTNIAFKEGLTLNAGATKKYKMTITFLKTSDNQNDNLDASFNIKLSVGNVNLA